jgi:hypothetical protein
LNKVSDHAYLPLLQPEFDSVEKEEDYEFPDLRNFPNYADEIK